MAATPHSDPKPTGDERNLVNVDPTTGVSFEEKLNLFWRKYRGAVLALCVVVLLAIIGKGAWEHFAQQKQREIGQAYAAATTPEQLKAFAAANGDHPLAGVAHMRMADQAYADGKYTDAIAGYDKALTILKDDPLAARARLGRALAKLQAGKTAEGQTELKQLAEDAKQFKAVRTEAGYHLASLAADAGNAAEVQQYADQLMQIDPQSPWTSRAMMLRATMPVGGTAAPATAAPASPATSTPAKADESPAGVEIKLPGKK